MLEQLLWAVVTIVLGVGGCFGYFYGSNLLLDQHLSGACRRHVAARHRNLKIQSVDPALAVPRAGTRPADRLSHLSGVRDHLAVVP